VRKEEKIFVSLSPEQKTVVPGGVTIEQKSQAFGNSVTIDQKKQDRLSPRRKKHERVLYQPPCPEGNGRSGGREVRKSRHANKSRPDSTKASAVSLRVCELNQILVDLE